MINLRILAVLLASLLALTPSPLRSAEQSANLGLTGEPSDVGDPLKTHMLQALDVELKRQGVRGKTYTIACDIAVGPRRDDGLRIAVLAWTVTDVDGKVIGTATQGNKVPSFLFWRWHPIWEDAAQGAAVGIARLIVKAAKGDEI